ncbi:hypothetical protein [Actinoplanes sp. NPDC051411]|uniref:hypothetical protein n=1 Tax=Actinoplanes sp. NPDC051411 TaxID=3155522 RepID=UPI0034478A62
MRIRSSQGPRRAAALLVATAAVMLAAACGGGSDKTTSSGGNGGGGANGAGTNQALTAYVDCMKQNGVTITLPSFAPRTGASRGTGSYTRPSGQPRPRPSGSFGGGRGGFPGGGGGAGFFQKPAGVDDATWQKAQQACASSLPSRGPGGGGFGGNGGQNSAYRNCLQQHGVTMNGGRPASTDPKTQQALKTCSVLRQSASPTPSS